MGTCRRTCYVQQLFIVFIDPRSQSLLWLYSEAESIPFVRIMLIFIFKPTRHDNFSKKYAARRFHLGSEI